MTTVKDTLSGAGLSDFAAEMYLLLMQHGPQTPSQLSHQTALSRTSIYEGLTELLGHKLVEVSKRGRNMIYTPLHPSHLTALIEQQKRDMSLREKEMEETIRSLSGSFQFLSQKPGVQFYAGLDQLEEALRRGIHGAAHAKADMLNLSSWQPGKNDAIANMVKRLAKLRADLGVTKRIILKDDPAITRFEDELGIDDFTKRKYISSTAYPSDVSIEVTPGMVLFMELTDDVQMGFAVSSQAIEQAHRYLFEMLWSGRA